VPLSVGARSRPPELQPSGLRNQPRYLTIGDASANPLHQLVVIDVVEAALISPSMTHL
jgi:hypothetical protein